MQPELMIRRAQKPSQLCSFTKQCGCPCEALTIAVKCIESPLIFPSKRPLQSEASISADYRRADITKTRQLRQDMN